MRATSRIGVIFVTFAGQACTPNSRVAGGFTNDGSPGSATTMGGEESGSTAVSGLTSDGSDSATTMGGEESGNTAASGPTSDSLATSSSETSTDPKFDLERNGDVTGADDGQGDVPCQRIDFLFVVDNSGSMQHHQAALINSFGPFIDTIYNTVKARDFHIMVADSDAGDDIMMCDTLSAGKLCGDWSVTKAGLDLACEGTPGAGEVAPYNFEASNRLCGVPDEKRYLTSTLSRAEIADKFTCMAKVGIKGSGEELPMSAMVEAVTTQNQPGACNEGFVRKDSVLVITVISDDYPVPNTSDDSKDIGSPQAWYEGVLQAKNGNIDHIVALGVINTADATCVAGAGAPIVHPTQRFVDFIERFEDRGFMGNICGADYNLFFEQAVAIIDTACNEFVPEG